MWGYYSRSIPPSCGILTFFSYWKVVKLNTLLAAFKNQLIIQLLSQNKTNIYNNLIDMIF